MRRSVTLLAVLLCLGTAPAALAQTQKVAPPGNSAIDEYVESVPSASGNHPTKPGGGQPAGLSKSSTAALSKLGKDGKAVEQLVAGTGGAVTKPSQGAKATKTPAGPTIVADSGRSPLAATAHAVLTSSHSDGGGMGILLPAILGAAVLAAIAAVVLRRRRSA